MVESNGRNGPQAYRNKPDRTGGTTVKSKSGIAALILAVIPVVVFYLSCQKYIIKGVAAGAVKG